MSVERMMEQATSMDQADLLKLAGFLKELIKINDLLIAYNAKRSIVPKKRAKREKV